MTDFTGINRLRRASILRDIGLDHALTSDELALRLLDIEMRLRNVERYAHVKTAHGNRPLTASEVI